MPKQVSTREEAVVKIAAAFREFGYDGASLSRLQAATGLKSSSLYNYFPNGKEDMAKAALAHADEQIAERALAFLSGPGTPRERAAAFAAALDRFYDAGRTACLVNVMGVGEAGERFRPDIGRTARSILHALSDLAEEVGVSPAEAAARAEDTLIAVEGALVLSRALGSTDPFRRMIASLPDRLLTPRD